MKKNLKGLTLVLILSTVSMLLNKYLVNFIETMTIGIILGIIITNTIDIPKSYDYGITFALKKILKIGIILLGVKLNFSFLTNLGPEILIIILILITTAILSSYYIGKSKNLGPKLSILLGVGSSVCGASAIVAMGPVIEANDEDIAISVTVISLLGALGVLVYSILSKILPLTDIQYGIWAGSSLQGVAHALAAAGARGTNSISLEIGTIVKMARVALLAPIAIILSFIFNNNSGRKKVNFPYYVLFFILVGIVFTFNAKFNVFNTVYYISNFEIDIIEIIKTISNFFILMSMVAMGLKVNLKSYNNKAFDSLRTCSLVFLIISILSIIMILCMNI